MRRLPGEHSLADTRRACLQHSREAKSSRWLGHCPDHTQTHSSSTDTVSQGDY